MALKTQRLDTLIENTVAAGVAMQVQSRTELDALVPGARHQGVIAVVRAVTYERDEKGLPDFLAALRNPRCCWSSTGCRIRTTWGPACARRMRPGYMP